MIRYCVAVDPNTGLRYVVAIQETEAEHGTWRLPITSEDLPESVRTSEPGLCYAEDGTLLEEAGA